LATGSHWLRTREISRPLPVNDAGQDQVQAAACVHLLPQLAGVNPAPPPVKDISGQGVELPEFNQDAEVARGPTF